MSLRPENLWRHSGSRPVDNSGRGERLRADFALRLSAVAHHSSLYMSSHVLEFKDVVKSYGEREILSGVSFQVRRAETKIIIGASGSGKSTILKLAMGLDKPDDGQIFINGEETTHLKEREMVHVRQNMGMVFQESALFDSLNVRENVASRLYELGADEAEIEERVRK